MLSSHDDLSRFAERYLLARDVALKSLPERGTSGFEFEWNLLDAEFRPLEKVGAGPDQRSFVDVMREDYIPDWLQDFNQLEVFHWMTEWTTRPYYCPEGSVFEGWILEACLINALSKAGRGFKERLFAHYGNLMYSVDVDHESIPGGWNLAKRRYLARCVDLHGSTLATAGIHTNLSLPEPLLEWDFLHLSPSERGDQHLDNFKNKAYIKGARILRAYTALFIATCASTPLRPEIRDGEEVVVLTEIDSVRNLIFPNPESLDIPDLYRSHEDYLRLSYDLVRREIRFGNNNWTPTRARSFAEPVWRMIDTTSDQLHSLYSNGLYSLGETESLDDKAQAIEIQNLLGRIDIPMARVEVRTDDGSHSLEVDIANLAFKELLLILSYADPAFGRAFRYDAEDIARARRNEQLASHHGLRAEIEDPFSGKPVLVRDFLMRSLEEVRPLAEGLERWDLLQPLVEMAEGGPNTSESLRMRLKQEIGGGEIIPLEVLTSLAEEREQLVAREVSNISAILPSMGTEAAKLQDLLWAARDEARRDAGAPIRFRPSPDTAIEVSYADKTAEIVDLSQMLIRIPSVTNAPPERQRLDDVQRAATFVLDYLDQAGLEVRIFEDGMYPAILAGFPGRVEAPIMLSGHFDVVEPEPDDTQFEPHIEGDYLYGRGAADMKTVVATYMVWMKDMLRQGGSYPAVNLLLIGNEEIGEGDPVGTPHVLAALKAESGYEPQLVIAGERTGEHGDELMGKVCTENRGLVRFEILARGSRGHTGMGTAQADLGASLLEARQELVSRLDGVLTLESQDSWHSQLRFPYVSVGQRGIYNVSADEAVLGVEIRTIPQDKVDQILNIVEQYCQSVGLELHISAAEDGVICSPDNPWLGMVLDSAREVFHKDPILGRKLPGTSARFAPQGQGIVWGQSGVGPHAADERHYIPSIDGYYHALVALGRRSLQGD